MFFLGLDRHWGSSCRVLTVLFVCRFRASRDSLAPAVKYCLVFLSVNFGLQGNSLASAVRYCLSFVSVNFGPLGTIWLQLSGIVWSCCLYISGLKGLSGSSCRVLFDLFVYQFQTSWDSLAPAVGYCLVLLSVNFGPQGTLWLRLSGVVWSFRLSVSGLRGLSGSSCRVLSGLSVCEFRASGNSLAPAVKHCLSLSISGLRGLSGSSCWVLSVFCVCSVCLSFWMGGRTEGGRRRRRRRRRRMGRALKSNNPNLKGGEQ